MSEKPRRRFQIHLPTAIVLMFVAGGVIWLNVREIYELHKLTIVESRRGWPLKFHNVEMYADVHEYHSSFYWREALCDFVIALAILGAVATVCELIIRREARKP